MRSPLLAGVLVLALMAGAGQVVAADAAAPASCKTATPKGAAKQSLKAFYAHVKYAHLQTAPSQQVHDAADASGYVKLHAVWLQSVLEPLVPSGSRRQSCDQTAPSNAPPPSAPPSNAPAQPAGPAGPEHPASGGTSVDIRGMAFHPTMLHIQRGTRVTWTNFDGEPHTVTSKDGRGPLDSPLLHKGDAWSYTFTKPGQYDYYCAVHPNMQAEVMVM